jgi:hypothetical protein
LRLSGLGSLDPRPVLEITMKLRILKALASVVAVLLVVLGCDSVTIPDGTTGGTDPAVAEDNNAFTDAPASPGGTGGSVGDELEGTQDVDLSAGATRSFFTAFQIDPEAEDSAGPKFVAAGDIDRDGLTDLVSAWNQNQPVQLHLQRRGTSGNISFRTITLAGTNPVAVVAGLQVGQINGDGWLDVVILTKATGHMTLCPKDPPEEISGLEGEIIILFSPGEASQIPNGDFWTQMILVNPMIRDVWIHNQFPGIEYQSFEQGQTKPEWNGFTDLVVADIDNTPGDDILVALNPGACEELGQEPPVNTVDLWLNPGPALAETSSAWGTTPPDGYSRGAPVALMADAPQVKDIEVLDIDGDGDLDVIATWTEALSPNIRWVRNPYVPHLAGGASGRAAVESYVDDGWRLFATEWQSRPIGTIDSGSDVIAIGDIDDDGSDDILVRSTIGQVVQFFRQPNALSIAPEFPPADPIPERANFPWNVYTLTEFTDQEPEAIGIGDLTGDGQNEVVVAVEGGVYWYDTAISATVYDPWFPHAIIQDSPPEETTAAGDGMSSEIAPPGSGVGVEAVDVSTHVNTLLIVDLDGDGRNDIVGTLDRRVGAGLSDDRLVWYRNTRTED